MTLETFALTPVWAGGSGDIGSNWIVGFVESLGVDGVARFVSWVDGPPTPNSSVYFEPTLEELGVIDADVGIGGALIGGLTCYSLTIENGSDYFLNGNVSATAAVAVSFGALTISGVGSGLSAGSLVVDATSGTSLLAIDDGAIVSATEGYVGFDDDTTGTLTISGFGSTLTLGGSLQVANGDGTGSVTIDDGATLLVADGAYLGGDDGTGTLAISGAGSTLTVEGGLEVGWGLGGGGTGLTTITDGASVSADQITLGGDNTGTLSISGAGSTLRVGGVLQVGNDYDGGIGTGLLMINGGASVSASEIYVGDDGAGTLTISGAGSSLTLGGALAVGLGGTGVGLLTIDDGAGVSTTSNAYVGFAGGAGTLTISGNETSLTVGSGLEVGANSQVLLNSGIVEAGTTTVDSGGTVSGYGSIDADVINNGTIIASGAAETLTIDGTVGGDGEFAIDSGATLELEGSFAVGGTISFAGPGPHTLIMDDPEDFHGSITGIGIGDQIILGDTSFGLGDTSLGAGNGVVAATIGELSGVQTLQIREAPDTNPLSPSSGGSAFLLPNIPIDGGADDGILDNDFFQVAHSADGTDTVLTLTQGNPVGLAVNAPEAWASGVDGAGVTIGVISDTLNEVNAMTQIIHDIAPDASVIPVVSSGDLDIEVASAIRSLTAPNIIVDNIAIGEEPDSGSLTESAINAAVAAGVTYITAADNFRLPADDGPAELIYGHAADPNALTVAAMNILATPNPPSTVGGYITPETEPFSSIGAPASGKPDITGPDGGPTTFDLLSTSPSNTGADPFFGTSAAASAVAAVAALMMQKNPLLKTAPLIVDQLIEQSALGFGEPANEMGAGLVQADRAVAMAAAYSACYLAGTRIATAAAERAIESLAVGDLVLTQSGKAAPIIWIGHRRIDCRRHPEPRKVWPVRALAGAFSAGVPSRDLWLSPDHAVFVDDVLIPIRSLINGTSIAQVATAEVTYFHVELGHHDILLAEGLPAESYLDTGNRHLFANGRAPLLLHPDLTEANEQVHREAGSCAPLATRADQVEPIWRRLAARATALGHGVSLPAAITDPRLRLSAGGHEMKPVLASAGRYVFVLPPLTEAVRILSHAGAPSDLRPWVDDRRRLGIPIVRIILRGDVGLIEIPVDHPSLVDGWHDVEWGGERAWRWTDGSARLAVPAGMQVIELHLAGSTEYKAEISAGVHALAA